MFLGTSPDSLKTSFGLTPLMWNDLSLRYSNQAFSHPDLSRTYPYNARVRWSYICNDENFMEKAQKEEWYEIIKMHSYL